MDSGRLSGQAGGPAHWQIPTTTPWQKCPVCAGKGTVPAGFYEHHGYAREAGSPSKCRSCNGRGIVR